MPNHITAILSLCTLLEEKLIFFCTLNSYGQPLSHTAMSSDPWDSIQVQKFGRGRAESGINRCSCVVKSLDLWVASQARKHGPVQNMASGSFHSHIQQKVTHQYRDGAMGWSAGVKYAWNLACGLSFIQPTGLEGWAHCPKLTDLHAGKYSWIFH